MTNDPTITAGINILRTAFERAAVEYTYPSQDDPEVIEKSTLTLGDVLADITVTGDLESGIQLSYEFKTPAGEKLSGEISIDDHPLRVAEMNKWELLIKTEEDISNLKTAINYRKQNYGFS